MARFAHSSTRLNNDTLGVLKISSTRAPRDGSFGMGYCLHLSQRRPQSHTARNWQGPKALSRTGGSLARAQGRYLSHIDGVYQEYIMYYNVILVLLINYNLIFLMIIILFHPPICFPQLSLFPEFNTLSVMYGELSTHFITQETPYVLNTTVASRGAGEL